MKERLKRLVEQYLREARKGKIHHIDVAVPEHDGRFWIIDASRIMEQPDAKGMKLAIYFSVNAHTRKGRRIVQVIDVMDPFENYQKGSDGLFTTFYLLSDNNSQSISEEVVSKIQTLFPTLDLKEVQLSIVQSDDSAGRGE